MDFDPSARNAGDPLPSPDSSPPSEESSETPPTIIELPERIRALLAPYEQQVFLAKREYEEGMNAIKSIVSAWSKDYQDGFYSYDSGRGALVKRVFDA